jgi:hypothetical protein
METYEYGLDHLGQMLDRLLDHRELLAQLVQMAQLVQPRLYLVQLALPELLAQQDLLT